MNYSDSGMTSGGAYADESLRDTVNLNFQRLKSAPGYASLVVCEDEVLHLTLP